MILSVGYLNLAFFHLLTHAIFKAILFLCAGEVIHGMGGAQDIRVMGNIWNVSPFVRIIIVLASISLFGFPFLSGFYSKDMILEVIYTLNVNIMLLRIVILATILTVIYSLRLRFYCI